ncbi:RagB/SusD family nutrient uptake outer membrane protein [Pedobacter vanadiisoli]|uniref:RagB/SusD family nutrient uptake outer membrane protein n=1 Tax=Pedobacter vanadiisoli TaxID=1761975 RepID=A0ABW5MGU1_9SPHI
MNKYIYSVLVLVVLLTSCDKYLDVTPKGVRLLQTIGDYDSWLNNVEVEYSTPPLLNQFDDHKDLPNISTSLSSTNEKMYVWQPQFVETVPGTAVLWANYYKTIYLFNTVVNNADNAIDGTDQDKRRLKAEGLLGRAFEYLSLVNLYAKPYNPATANTDLAVPFVTSIDVTDDTPPRASVQELYNHIISDINTAIPDLPKDNASNRFRGSKAAGYATLARTYLFMGNYTKAAEYAQLALNNGPNVIVDYGTLTDATGIAQVMKRPDAIYARLGGTAYLTTEIPTLDFLKSFDTKDLRLKFWYRGTGDYSFTARGQAVFQHSGIPAGLSNASPNWGISVAEMHMILAESAARTNDLAKACDELDQLRKKRFLAVNYQKFTSNDKDVVLNKIFSERSFEFAFCGMRWFDMRRLNAEGKMPAVNRYNGTGGLVATLAPGSDRYVLRIPLQVMYFNPSWQQNP